MTEPARWVPSSSRPVIMGTRHMVSAGHYLAAAAGYRILEAGGNAFDAGVAMGLCINVLQSDLTNIGGVAPICTFSAATGAVEVVSGLGWWPARADREHFVRSCEGRIPPGVHRCVVPAAIDAWLTALERGGTMTLAQVAEPAIELAVDGFPMHQLMRETLSDPRFAPRLWEEPSMRRVYYRDGDLIPLGGVVRQEDLGRTLGLLVEAERGAPSREAGIRAARDRFYTGDIAAAIAKASADQGGWLAADDLAEFHVEVEAPLKTTYRGVDVYGCPTWCQGAVALETLNILEQFDLASLGAGSAAAYHLVLEALKGAFADRDRYEADPRFVDVPIDGLLSKEYAAAWRDRIDPAAATPGMPEPGDPWAFSAGTNSRPDRWRHPDAVVGAPEPDTSYLCAVDRHGNAFSATPSDGVGGSPVVPGYGFVISGRGAQSWLDPDHPAAIEPRKRPRLTPAPGMVVEGGHAMPYGTPGNDVQPQAMVQFLVNVLDFGMDVQQAIDAPRCVTYSFPSSSHPHEYRPGVAYVEGRVAADVPAALERMGHRLKVWPAWTGVAGSMGAIRTDARESVLHGAADPRRVAYAVGR